MTVPNGAACYFCLGEEADEEGKPLVRDCSCRGDSGFAHLDCLFKYAEQKCKAVVDGDLAAFAESWHKFSEPWYKCNNCKQPFQNQLSIDLASAFVSFTEASYSHPSCSKWDKLKVLESLRMQIVALAIHGNEVDKTERTMLINNMLSIINQTKKDLNMSRWIHMPKASVEYQYYKALCGNYEAFAYSNLGIASFTGDFSDEESQIAMMMHLKKARAIYNLVDMKDCAQRMDTLIPVLTAEKQDANDGEATSSSVRVRVTNSILQKMSEIYKLNLHTKGMDSEETILSGVLYAKCLWDANHCIEAERLVTKLATISRRVLGPDHKITIDAVELLKEVKVRFVNILPDMKPFQALRYENDGEICVVQGPIIEPRRVDDERLYRVESHLIHPVVGCPVMCHCLGIASHLNGELGEVRNVEENETGTTRLAVHFEMKGVKSALVKPENLRIAFELPSKV